MALGNYLFLNMRTGVRSLDERGFAEAHEHQDSVRIEAKSAKPYKAKGFEKKSLDATRARLKARMAKADKPELYFNALGKPNNIDVEKDWTMLIRLYAPKDKEANMEYMKNAEDNIRVALVEGR